MTSKAKEVMAALEDFVVGEMVLVPEYLDDRSRVLVSAMVTRIGDDLFQVYISATNSHWTRPRRQVRKDWTRWPPKPKKS